MELLYTIANQAAVAVVNATLYQDARLKFDDRCPKNDLDEVVRQDEGLVTLSLALGRNTEQDLREAGAVFAQLLVE